MREERVEAQLRSLERLPHEAALHCPQCKPTHLCAGCKQDKSFKAFDVYEKGTEGGQTRHDKTAKH